MLNDAKWISIIVYVTSVVLTVMLIGAIALDDYINTDAAIFCSGLIAVSIVVLLILFLPKVSILMCAKVHEYCGALCTNIY